MEKYRYEIYHVVRVDVTLLLIVLVKRNSMSSKISGRKDYLVKGRRFCPDTMVASSAAMPDNDDLSHCSVLGRSDAYASDPTMDHLSSTMIDDQLKS
ncbi:hypothetical protein TorRG33x02_309790, partial [Trema orientale]